MMAAWAVLLVLGSAGPASAQVDLSGEWSWLLSEDRSEPFPGDYAGIPMNDAARLRADTFDASNWTLPEWQCRPHPADYITRGASQLKIVPQIDPVSRATTAIVAQFTRYMDMPIYLDGRPHPSRFAAHTWGGFSTGQWIGNMLKVTTTHLKDSYLRRNGIHRSDKATLTHYIYRNGDVLTWVIITYDPVYLVEPLIRSSEYRLNVTQVNPPFPCTVVQEVERPAGVVPHYLPGRNDQLDDYASMFRIPFEATRGWAESIYPDYLTRLKQLKAAASSAIATLTAPFRSDPPPRAAPAPVADEGIAVVHVAGPVYMLANAGGNITVSAGGDGVLLVDTGAPAMTDRVLATIREIQAEVSPRDTPLGFGVTTKSSIEARRSPPPPPKPIQFIINTSIDEDHIGGNARLAAAGGTFAGGDVAAALADVTETASVYAHENVLLRLAKGATPAPQAQWPTDTYHTPYYKISNHFNGEGIQIIHQPAAHSDGDSTVWFRRSDVIATGDIFSMDSYPVIDMARGGSIQGVITSLNAILDLAFPEFRTEGGTMIVPGHGRLADVADVGYYRDMLTIIRDRVQDMRDRGMTLDQIKAAGPSGDYDGRFGATAGSWTTDMFIEAVYRGLSR
jgi:glyoxylase-like metal-dependent hydrolase (beta-lactamase superfamily II)